MQNTRECLKDLQEKFVKEQKQNKELVEMVVDLKVQVEEMKEEVVCVKSDMISNWLLPIVLTIGYFYFNSESGKELISNEYLTHTQTIIVGAVGIALIFIKDIIRSSKWRAKQILQKGIF